MALTTFGSQSVNSNSILARYTLLGDANLDGKVNLSDFLALRHNFGLTSSATWDQGDFDYDGKVNLNDFLILRKHFGQSLPSPPSAVIPAAASASGQNATAVPEPPALVLVACAGLIGVGGAAGRRSLSRRFPRQTLTPASRDADAYKVEGHATTQA